MNKTDLNLLTLFATVLEAGSISEAARQLELPKSSVSRRLTRLEEKLGTRLLHRTPRKLAPSPAGAALYEQLKPQLLALRETLASLERDGHPSGELKVTAPLDLGTDLLPDLIARFSALHPAIRVELLLTDEIVDLVSARIDVALRVRFQHLVDTGLHGRPIGPFAVGLYASPAYLARRGSPASPEDLTDHDAVVVRGIRELELTGHGRKAHVLLSPRITGSDLLFLREILLRGMGIGLLTARLARPEVEAGRLVEVLPGWSLPEGELWLVWPSRPHAAAKVAAFRDFAIEALRPWFSR